MGQVFEYMSNALSGCDQDTVLIKDINQMSYLLNNSKLDLAIQGAKVLWHGYDLTNINNMII